MQLWYLLYEWQRWVINVIEHTVFQQSLVLWDMSSWFEAQDLKHPLILDFRGSNPGQLGPNTVSPSVTANGPFASHLLSVKGSSETQVARIIVGIASQLVTQCHLDFQWHSNRTMRADSDQLSSNHFRFNSFCPSRRTTFVPEDVRHCRHLSRAKQSIQD
jgi:hypothetical protein